MTRVALIVAIASTSLAILAPAALAGTASVAGGVMTYTAPNGEDNAITITPTAGVSGGFTLTDPGTGTLTAGAGCSVVAGTLRCTGVTSIVLTLRDGDDLVDLAAVSIPTTVSTGAGFDSVIGGGGVDTITAGIDDDSIAGGAGNDVIDGGPDFDAVAGGLGDDDLDGGTENDIVRGDAGNDLVNGGDDGASDSVLGGSGIDTVDYSARTLRVNVTIDGLFDDGELGEDDSVETDVENVLGGTGNDSLAGSDSGANVLTGGDGNDSLVALAGADTLNGGAGEDFLSGGMGADALSGGTEDDVLDGGGSADTLDAGAGSDSADGGAENDSIDGGTGDDGLLGGEGDDTITDPSGTNAIDGGAGDDILTGGDGSETVFGRSGSDQVFGGPGDDTLKGGDGSDILSGQAGVDVLDGGPAGDVLGGGDGTDKADYISRVVGVTVTLDDISNDGEPAEFDNVLSDVENVDGGWGNDSITGSNADNVLTDGPAGNDTLIGLGGNDTLGATQGNDLIAGGDGNDTMRGGTGNDAFDGGTGVDLVAYDDHAADVTASIDGVSNDGSTGEADAIATTVENLTGGPGNDALTGSAVPNHLDGGDGNDTLTALAATDTYAGGNGADTVSYGDHTAGVNLSLDGLANDGSTGENENLPADVENLTGGSGSDALLGTTGTNVLAGGLGVDTVSYAGHSASTSVSTDDVANDGAAGESDNVRSDIENLIGGAANDVLTGGPAANSFQGGLGADTFNGLGGIDTVSYGDHPSGVVVSIDGVANDGSPLEGDNVGADIENLTGGLGSDFLTGSAGANVFDGGLGADVFVGLAGVDTVSYSSRTLALTVKINGSADDGQAGEGDNVMADIENLIGGAGADTLVGSALANVITGGLGADRIDGASGNDTLFAKDRVKDLMVNGGKGTDAAQVDKSDVKLSIERILR